MLSECPQTPPENAPGGTLETPPRDRLETPGKGTEKDHFGQLVNNHRAVGDSSRKCRFGSIVEHSPISLTLPLSSPKGDGFATTPARGRRLPVRASVIFEKTSLPNSVAETIYYADAPLKKRNQKTRVGRRRSEERGRGDAGEPRRDLLFET